MFWVIALTVVLTLLGSSVLVFITVKYYWGIRGGPPPSREERRRRREEELQQRARQIEYAESHKWETRSSDFFDNTKK